MNHVQPKRIVWPEAGRASVEAFEVTLPRAGEVLVETSYSLVSPGTEAEWLSSDESHFIFGTTFPFTPGYAAAGVVAAVGDGVEGWKAGDRVAVGYNNLGRPYGMHSSHILTLPQHLNRVPGSVSLKEAVFFNIGQTAVHVVQLTGLRLSDDIAIVGQGPIGNLAVQVARAAGASRIVALDLVADRRADALRAGATEAFDPTAEGEVEGFLARTGGAGRAIDLSASQNGVNTAVQIAAPLGTIVLSTGYAGHMDIDYGAIFVKGLHVIGGFVNARLERAASDIATFLRLLERDQIDVGLLLSAPQQPDAAPEVYRRLLDQSRTTSAPIFEWKAEPSDFLRATQ